MYPTSGVNIVWNIEQKRQRLQRLLDFIRVHEELFHEGCPRLLLYAFVKSERLTAPWLHETLRNLEQTNVIRVPSRDHYQVIAYDRLRMDRALYGR